MCSRFPRKGVLSCLSEIIRSKIEVHAKKPTSQGKGQGHLLSANTCFWNLGFEGLSVPLLYSLCSGGFAEESLFTVQTVF
jgi:hypothetical protein